MKRNILLRYITITLLLTTLSLITNFASATTGNVYKFKIGQIDATVLSDGRVMHIPLQPNHAPDVPESELVKVLTDYYASTTEVEMAANILLLQSDGKKILVDAGSGDGFGEGCGWLIANLQNIGISPSDITDIVITHAHCDHVGGMTDKNGTILFPNADIHISQPEYDFWMSPNPDFSKSKFTNEATINFLVEVAQNNIGKYASRVHPFNDGDILFGFMEMILAPGHTPGHTMIRIFSGDDEIYHAADIAHSVVLQFHNPDWGVEPDTDYELSGKTRRKFMQRFTDARATVFGYHLPWPGLGNIRKQGDGFEWIQKRFAIPY